jgi:hypothetical protein
LVSTNQSLESIDLSTHHSQKSQLFSKNSSLNENESSGSHKFGLLALPKLEMDSSIEADSQHLVSTKKLNKLYIINYLFLF